MRITTLSPSPLQHLVTPLIKDRGVEVLVKRDDLLYYPNAKRIGNTRIRSAFCGNKYRKLKYNLLEAQQRGYKQLLTFGGAYSNHITATAEAGALLSFKTIGIIRGEEHQPLNPSLQYAKACGMHFHYLDRATFRHKYDEAVRSELERQFGRFYLLPEGGTNDLAIRGVKELVDEIPEALREATFAVSCGTGGTLAGVIEGLQGRGQALGFSALKGDFLTEEVARLLSKPFENWSIQTDYHFGGYAKFKPPLVEFINLFKETHNIQLDPIYTGKLFYGLFDLIRQGYFPKGTTIIVIHTGGLQGIHGFNERFGGVINC